MQEQMNSTNKVHCKANEVQCVTNCCFRTGNKKILNQNALLVLGILAGKCSTTELTSSALFCLFLILTLPLMMGLQMMDSS